MWTTIFQNKSGREPSSHLSELIVSFIRDVTMYSSSEIPMQSCLCSKSFDLYSRKDKSNIICWETIILTFMINLSSNKVILLFQNILSGCDCETCGPGDLFIAHGVKCPKTYLPDLIHLKNSRVVKWKYQLRSIQIWSWLLSVHVPKLTCEDVLSMKDPTVINCVASHILFVVEVYDCQRSPNNLSNMYY